MFQWNLSLKAIIMALRPVVTLWDKKYNHRKDEHMKCDYRKEDHMKDEYEM